MTVLLDARGLEKSYAVGRAGLLRGARRFNAVDGIDLKLGGARVDRYGGRRPCDTNGWVEVSVPEAGWYKLDALFYQRRNTACLMMRWRKPDGTEEWTPQSAWAFTQ